jgi:hypothetical protein
MSMQGMLGTQVESVYSQRKDERRRTQRKIVEKVSEGVCEPNGGEGEMRDGGVWGGFSPRKIGSVGHICPRHRDLKPGVII